MAILFDKKERDRRPCEAPAGKEDPLKNQQGKKTLWSTSWERRPFEVPAGKEDLWSTGRERRLCEAPAEKEETVKYQQGKKTRWNTSWERKPFEVPAGKEDLWSTSRERRNCEVPAGKEDSGAPAEKEDPVKYQQGKKTLWSTSRERRPCEVPAGKEDPFAHQQGIKTYCTLAGQEDWYLPLPHVLYRCTKSWYFKSFFRNHMANFHKISCWSYCWNGIQSLFNWLCFIDCHAHV